VKESGLKNWQAKEEEFHLEQAILRSKLRIESGREKPIDFLVKVLLIFMRKLEVPAEVVSEDYKRPYEMFALLGREELEEILEEMKVYELLEKKNEFY